MGTDTPQSGQLFAIKSWRHIPESTDIIFQYTCNIYGDFHEKVTFPGTPKKLEAFASGSGAVILDLLSVALGVSTYKLAAASTISLPPLTRAGRVMAKSLYTEGLAEFYVRNSLPYPPPLTFAGEILDALPAAATRQEGPPLVAFGGGKDSYVARAILKRAGHQVQLASVVLGEAVENVLTATAPKTPLFIQRRLDPKLYEIAPKAFSGHVPITAINMLVLAVSAELLGYGSVVFANERSADEPTMKLKTGEVANHQYSKSSHFERLINLAISDVHPRPMPIYSILRPYSELWIGRAFASQKEAFGKFTSCNRNFRLAGDADKRWCGNCAKCAFTSLILAPFISREDAIEIFGDVFPDRPNLLPVYEELLGLSSQKPWDCVGTIDECRAALWHISKNSPFTDTLIVSTFLSRIENTVGTKKLETLWAEALIPQPPLLPGPLARAAESIGT